MLRRLFKSFWVKHLLCKYKWYRKWYGGRWEKWYIDVCHGFIWLDCHGARQYPRYRQPCGRGIPAIEDYNDINKI